MNTKAYVAVCAIVSFCCMVGVCADESNEEAMQRKFKSEQIDRIKLVEKFLEMTPAEQEKYRQEQNKRYEEWKAKALAKIPDTPLSASSTSAYWTRGCDTNDVTITVAVGTAYTGGSPLRREPIFRNLTFDKDGKLKAVSRVFVGDRKSNPSNIKR